MNQSIQFPDSAEWQAEQQRVHFPAQLMGGLIPCYISRHRLERLAGLSLVREDDILRAFDSLRFDIEDMVEKLIEEQEFGEDGAIYL
ncbi:DUF1488 family protein [Aeromonas bivalvium]|uniref:DUF1488 domain-containing protein n=1 Tax=Aeromonas bivalvium TaxID=440079 RepID=UPI0005A708B9|nr:DUF1488 domain-containing protein [Aeromonas bivalvium]